MSFLNDGFSLIQDIDVRLTVELGRKNMRLRDVLALGESSVIELDRLTDGEGEGSGAERGGVDAEKEVMHYRISDKDEIVDAVT